MGGHKLKRLVSLILLSTGLFGQIFIPGSSGTTSGGSGLVTYAALAVVLSGGTGAVFVPFGGDGLGSTTEADVQMKVQPVAIVRNMCVNLSAAPGMGNSLVFRLRANAGNTTITVTITGSGVTNCDTTHTYATAAGDLLDWSITPSGVIALYTPNVMISTEWAGSSGGGTVSAIATACGLSGGPITTTGTISRIPTVNAQSGASYAIQNSDCGKQLNLTNAGAVALSIAQVGAGGLFLTGWFTDYICTGAGGCVLTPATSTVNGAATLTLSTNQSARLWSDGTNYFANLGKASGGGGSSIAIGSIASLPASCTNDGDTYYTTDGLYIYVCLSTAFQAFYGSIPVVPPIAANFSWVNQGTASFTAANGGQTVSGPNTAGTQLRARVASVPATPWTADTFVSILSPGSTISANAGLMLRESGTGKIETINCGDQTTNKIQVLRWTNATTFASLAKEFTPATYFMSTGMWIRAADDGANITYSLSLNGLPWITLHTEASGSFFTTGPDQIGVYFDSESTGQLDQAVSLIHLKFQ